MRIIHTSDWHLGQHFYGKSRAPEHQAFLTWLLTQVEIQKIDAVIVAGDIFDTGTPPSYAREMYFDFIVNMHKLGCNLVILAGNHDSVAMLGESKKLLSHLSTRVIPAAKYDVTSVDEQVIGESEQVFYLKDNQGNNKAVLCAIPFLRPRDVLKSQAGQSAQDIQQSLQQAIKNHYDRLYQQAVKLAELSLTQKLPIIATGHLTTVGVSISESVRDIYIGTLEAFPANAFPDADYIALGHIHRRQKVANTEHIRYCGSPIPLSFDEANKNKCVLIVEFDQGKLSSVSALEVPCIQPIVMIKSTLDEIATKVEQVVFEHKNTLQKQQKIWLDIEIDSSDYLQDLQSRINQLIEQLPVEILLVRRSKKSRQAMPNNQKKITLNELSLDDVFNTRLDKEDWQGEQALKRKERITMLYQQAVSEALSEVVSEAVIESEDEVAKDKT